MRPSSHLIIAVSIGIVLMSQDKVSGQTPLGPEFTYQGKLDEGGSGANGIYDLQFRLYDASVGGNLASDPFVANSVAVTDGLFTVPLNFGYLNGDALWLEVDVRVNGVGSWTTLSPRQALTAAPFALYSLGPWQTSGNALSNTNSGFVGIGRNDPVTPSEVFGIWKDTASFAGMYIETSGDFGQPFYGYSAGGGVDAFHAYSGVSGDWYLNNGGATRMTVTNYGFVGIGTADPDSTLDVNGTITAYGLRYPSLSTPGGSLSISHFAAGHIIFSTNTTPGSSATARLLIQDDGLIGIGTINPNFTLHVDGSAGKPGGGSWSNSSDIRLKKNIEYIDGALDSLLELRGVTFEYIDPEAISELPGERVGMIAQDVEKVFPDWVDERKDGYKAVTFRGFEALTVEALRELREEKNAQIEHQHSRIETLERENDELRDHLEWLEAMLLELHAK